MLNGFALGAWYRILDRHIGADRTRIQTVLSKCLVDQVVYAPFSITSFVGYAAILKGGGVGEVVRETKRNLEETFWSTWLMDWKVWPAANLVMFRLIPSSYRPSFASVVQVAWQAYMSSVNYDNPHIAELLDAQPSDDAAQEAIRGGAGQEEQSAGLVHGVAAPSSQKDAPIPSRRTIAMVDRRATGRYVYGLGDGDEDKSGNERRGLRSARQASAKVLSQAAGEALGSSVLPKSKEL